jgi:methionine biosynthesis protein MetW
MNPEARDMRFDLKIIASWIEPGSKVLDLGCGSGELLYHLKYGKQVIGTGIDRHEDQVARCIANGLTVLQGDINEEVLDYPDNAFDYVILSQTLQQVYEPAALLKTLLRIGRKVVVSFPSFSHWAVRLSLLLTGCAPVTKELPYEWYNTPNIRVISITDFRNFSKKVGFAILREAAVNTHISDKREGYIVKIFPALRATYGIFLIAEKAQ